MTLIISKWFILKSNFLLIKNNEKKICKTLWEFSPKSNKFLPLFAYTYVLSKKNIFVDACRSGNIDIN